MLLFMLASGLTLIFSMMGVLNFAHASFYMLGAYLRLPDQPLGRLLAGADPGAGCWSAWSARWSSATACATCTSTATCAELLFTFGLAFVIEELVQMVWGKSPVDFRVPALLDFPAFTVFATNYPAYKLFMLLISVGIFVACSLMLTRTRVGLIMQAALTHPHMVAPSATMFRCVFMLVFGVGAALAGLAGVIAGPALVTQPSMAALLGPILFVVVVVGGLGSLPGAFFASLLIGLLQTFAIAVDLSLRRRLRRLRVQARARHAVRRSVARHGGRRSRRSCPTSCWS